MQRTSPFVLSFDRPGWSAGLVGVIWSVYFDKFPIFFSFFYFLRHLPLFYLFYFGKGLNSILII